MAESQSSPNKGLTPGKAVLIAVLSVVLVVVLYVQFGGKGDDAGTEKPSAYRPPRPAIAVQPADDKAKAAPVTLATAKVSASSAGKVEKASAALQIDETRWKAPKLDVVVAYDPFALPASFPQPAKAGAGGTGKDGDLLSAAAADDAKRVAEEHDRQLQELEELRTVGVHAIVREGDHWVAVVGDRTLRVGDTINDFVVTAIDPDDPKGSVHIERKESP